MPSFTYTARALNGELKTATIDAANKDDVVAQLRQRGDPWRLNDDAKPADPPHSTP